MRVSAKRELLDGFLYGSGLTTHGWLARSRKRWIVQEDGTSPCDVRWWWYVCRSSLSVEYIEDTIDWTCGPRAPDTRPARYFARWDGRDCSVASVVLWAAVQVSRVTMTLAGSTPTGGRSETRMAWKGGGWLDTAMWGGSGGTLGGMFSSIVVETVRTLSEERDVRAFRLSGTGGRGTDGGGGGVREGRGGDLLPRELCGLSGSLSVSSSVSADRGRGGSGGLVGGDADSSEEGM